MQQGHTILCGDFNAVPNRDLDVSGQTKHSRNRLTLQDFISSSGLYDMWRCHFSSVHHTYSRIDLFLVDKFILQQISKCELHCITWSDHAPISVVVGDRCAETRANRWRNDIFTLSQPQNRKKKKKNKIEKAIKEFFAINAPSVSDPFTLWNAHKVYIRGLLIQMSARAKRQRLEKLNTILAQIQQLEKLNKRHTTQNIREALFMSRQEL